MSPDMSATLRESIRQRVPFASPEVEVFLTLARAWDMAAEEVSATVQAAGVSVAQYNVLRILRGAEPEGLQTYQVVERLVARAPNITRLVDKLEAGGLLTRTRSTEDRRVVRLRITPKGLDLVAGLQGPVDGRIRDAMGALTADEQVELRRLLDRLREPLEQRRQGRGAKSRPATSRQP
jgi:DNA-binding MarR family transcriptional regulator